jgi:hypothetical protein
MSDNLKIQNMHPRRSLYIRQSSATQALVNRESTEHPYPLTEQALQLGRSKTQIIIIDEALAHSGSGIATRTGSHHTALEVFAHRREAPQPDFVFVPPGGHRFYASVARTDFAVTPESSAPASIIGFCIRLLSPQRVERSLRRIDVSAAANQNSPAQQSQQATAATQTVECRASSDSRALSRAHAQRGSRLVASPNSLSSACKIFHTNTSTPTKDYER